MGADQNDKGLWCAAIHIFYRETDRRLTSITGLDDWLMTIALVITSSTPPLQLD
jgi:hypothetical protein